MVEEIKQVSSILDINDTYLTLERTISKVNEYSLYTSSDYYILSVLEIKNGYLKIKVKDNTICIHNGIYAAYYPPFSVIKYCEIKGEITAKFLYSNKIDYLVDDAFITPSNIVLFNSFSIDLIFQFLINKRKTIFSNKPDIENWAVRVKNAIDVSYQSSITISEIAKGLRISKSLATISFKRHYGITPAVYKNQLRLNKALITLSKNRKQERIADLAIDLGFMDVSTFNRQMRKMYKIKPSELN